MTSARTGTVGFNVQRCIRGPFSEYGFGRWRAADVAQTYEKNPGCSHAVLLGYAMAKIKNIVVLTGAGISAESGINTFRDNGGLWEQHNIEDVATPQAFAVNPGLVHRFYNERRRALETAYPNPAHAALAELEAALGERGGLLTIVTQNVDNLHERGGAKNVMHMHGRLHSVKCCLCGVRRDFGGATHEGMECGDCGGTGSIRPDIVWFGEIPHHMDEIEAAILSCDLFVSIGTSGAVYPAAGYVQLARSFGKQTLELNLESSGGSHLFHNSRLGKAGKIVPAWVNEIIKTLP